MKQSSAKYIEINEIKTYKVLMREHIKLFHLHLYVYLGHIML